jgi:hypothetical protein
MRVKMAVSKIQSVDSKAKGFLEEQIFCKIIGCTGWSKFTGKVQLPLLEVIFQ